MRIFMFNFKKKLQSEYFRNPLALLLSLKEGVHRTCPKALPLTLDYEVTVGKNMSQPTALYCPLSTRTAVHGVVKSRTRLSDKGTEPSTLSSFKII